MELFEQFTWETKNCLKKIYYKAIDWYIYIYRQIFHAEKWILYLHKIRSLFSNNPMVLLTRFYSLSQPFPFVFCLFTSHVLWVLSNSHIYIYLWIELHTNNKCKLWAITGKNTYCYNNNINFCYFTYYYILCYQYPTSIKTENVSIFQ